MDVKRQAPSRLSMASIRRPSSRCDGSIWASALLAVRLLLAACLGVVGACSLVATADPLQAGCGPGAKACVLPEGDLGCVDVSDPAYGCAGSSCVPCTLPGTSETCGTDGLCAVGTCELGLGNCNRNSSDGCETDLTRDYANCTTCGHSCDEDLREMPHTLSAKCSAMRCMTSECEQGFGDCDTAAGNGCETRFSPEQCGRCEGCPEGTQCSDATQTCE